ncbi:mechanosensitive ion channel family protein [Salinarimonas soli]|uniref:Mechanosensitive ion channel n=1 Tax=Salinarimonas soli TaxID=1638099 RepID=A0A5B2VG69_9HYPH|nr:mechanosensitive ion channel domain-containing protein [Salinarimonas soli]KAA2237329.1 mechanosensitive ion channel [Salinarimonas soli]
MEQIGERLADVAAAVGRPWALVQLAVVAGCVGLGFALNALIEPALEARVRRIRRWPRMLRVLAVVLRRMRWILAAALLWAAYVAIRETTWPSRSTIVGLAAMLVSAWVLIAIASRVIRNRTLGQIVAVAGWILATLAVLGLLRPAADLLGAYGLTLGATRISVLSLLEGIALLGVLLWLASFVGDLVEGWLGSSPDITPSFQVLFGKLAKVALFTAAVLFTLSAAGIDLTTLTVFSGAIGLGLGFGLQKVISNLVSGMIILADRSIKPGDVIQLGETFGWIQSLRARFVSVVTRDGRKYLIPNEDLITKQVINWSYTEELVRLDVTFRVAYDCNPHAIRRIAVEAAERVGRVEAEPGPLCHLQAFGEYSLEFVLRFWIRDPAAGLTNVRGAVLLALWDAFQANGVEIPLPQREVFVHRAGPLRAGSTAPGTDGAADGRTASQGRPE